MDYWWKSDQRKFTSIEEKFCGEKYAFRSYVVVTLTLLSKQYYEFVGTHRQYYLKEKHREKAVYVPTSNMVAGRNSFILSV